MARLATVLLACAFLLSSAIRSDSASQETAANKTDKSTPMMIIHCCYGGSVVSAGKVCKVVNEFMEGDWCKDYDDPGNGRPLRFDWTGGCEHAHDCPELSSSK
ncbi:unnamed protein product [Symbiodinium sp. CCMP2592]|nr:unnamed protein product [Symbiodinium sp. CCMP2592]